MPDRPLAFRLRLIELFLGHAYDAAVSLGHHTGAVGIRLRDVGNDGFTGWIADVPDHDIDAVILESLDHPWGQPAPEILHARRPAVVRDNKFVVGQSKVMELR